MKRLLLACFLIACGSSTTTGDDASTDASNDATANDAAKDSSANDASTNDASPSDASSDDGSTFGDGGLTSGSPCDPKNNLCMSTLLCCSEPTHNFDGGPLSAYECEQPTNGKCPLLP